MKKIEAGQKYEIKANSNSHHYPIGFVVTVANCCGFSASYDSEYFYAVESVQGSAWYVLRKDCIPIGLKPGKDCLF